MPEFYHGMDPAEHERFTLLMEEASEVVQAVCKCLRHGPEGGHPLKEETNREAVEREVGDFMHCVKRMLDNGDLSVVSINEHQNGKQMADKVQYLHHNDR